MSKQRSGNGGKKKRIHLGKRDGDEQPNWECLWELAGKGSEPSPSGRLAEPNIPPSMKNSSLTFSLFFFFRCLVSTVLFVVSIWTNNGDKRRFNDFHGQTETHRFTWIKERKSRVRENRPFIRRHSWRASNPLIYFIYIYI